MPRRLQRHHKAVIDQQQYIMAQQHRLDNLNEQILAIRNDPVITGRVLEDIERTVGEIKRLEFVERYLEESIQVEQARRQLKEAYDRGQLEDGLDGFEVLAAKASSGLESVKSRAQAISNEFRSLYEERLLTALKGALETCQWPQPIDPGQWDSPAVTAFVTASQDWVRFHLGDMRPLMKVLVEPVKIRFAFHFESDRPTNRADRPEWAFAHLLKVASEHAQFFAAFLQPMLVKDDSNVVGLLDLFLEDLVALARDRLNALKPVIAADALMLSHMIEETVKFHQCLWEEYGFEDGQSCLGLFVADEECLRFWLANEKKALNVSFKAAAENHHSWTIDPASSGAVDPFIYEVVNLFNSVTLLYEGIEDNRVRVAFLLGLQIPLIESLYASMEFGLPAFHSTPDDLLQTLAIANSAAVFLRVLREDWSQNLVFIEMGLSDAFTSSAPSNGIFEKSIEAFGESLLHGAVLGNIHAFLWDQFTAHANVYARAMHYGLTIEKDQVLLPHPDLEKALISLNNSIDWLRQNHLDPSLLAQIQGRLIRSIGDYFFSKVVLKNYFHARGMAEFKTHLEATAQRLETILSSSPQAIQQALCKTFEALTLLQLSPSQTAELSDALSRNNFAQVSATLKALTISHLSMPECSEILKLRK